MWCGRVWPWAVEVYAAEILELDVDDPEGLLTQPAKGRLTFHAMTVPSDGDDDDGDDDDEDDDDDEEDDAAKKKKRKKKKNKKAKKRKKSSAPPSAELYALSCNVEVRPHHLTRVLLHRQVINQTGSCDMLILVAHLQNAPFFFLQLHEPPGHSVRFV